MATNTKPMDLVRELEMLWDMVKTYAIPNDENLAAYRALRAALIKAECAKCNAPNGECYHTLATLPPGSANKPPLRIYLSRGTPTGSWASDWEWSGCWSIHPSENAVEYRLVVTLCGNCGVEYMNVSDAEKHGIGKCGGQG